MEGDSHEAEVRIDGAVRWLDHAIAGDADPSFCIKAARRLLLVAKLALPPADHDS